MRERPKDNVHAGDASAHICAYRGLVDTVRVCVYACERNSVFQLRLVKRVVHSSQKERERNRESMCARHPDTLREIVSMCETEILMHIKCVHLCVRLRYI